MPEITLQFVLFCIFSLSIIILLWYYLFYFARVSFHKETPLSLGRGAGGEVPASVIICAKNEDHNLPEFLPIVLSQDYSEYEVIVVDDCSSDNTTDVLREFEKKYSHLKVITIKEDLKHYHGKKFALMVGIKGATHEHLLLTDADCKPTSNQWLKKMMSEFSSEKEIVLGYSKYEKLPGLLNKLIRFDTFHIALQYLSFAMAGIPYMGVGRNLSYKRTLFFRHKGFSSINHIPGGDDDLFVNKAATKKNTAVVIDKDAATLSIPRRTWKSWLNQKNRHYSTSKYYKPLHKLLLGLYSASQFLLYPLLLLAALFYNWQIVLSVYGLRFLIQAFVYFFSMKKLNEKDLWPFFLFFDIWMFFYYIIFASALWKKTRRTWN